VAARARRAAKRASAVSLRFNAISVPTSFARPLECAALLEQRGVERARRAMTALGA